MLVLAAGLVVLAGCATPADPATPYQDRVDDPVAGLTPEEIGDLRAGNGMGYALAAELNGYPGPKHVLDLAEELELTADQRDRVASIRQGMLAEAVPAGERLIDAHMALDALFSNREATPENVRAATATVAEAEAALRAVHLEAHIVTLQVLTHEQNQQYQALRGYGDGHSGHGTHG